MGTTAAEGTLRARTSGVRSESFSSMFGGCTRGRPVGGTELVSFEINVVIVRLSLCFWIK